MGLTMTELTLRQHGEPTVLTREDYEGRWIEYLTVLERHKILGVQPNGPHILIHPNQYVGIGRCPVGRIRIEPRFPDLLVELKHLFPRQHRGVLLPGYAPAANRVAGSDTPAIFIDQLNEVLYIGLPFDYQHQTSRSSVLSGSLDIGRTIKEFDSLGIHHRAVVRQKKRITNTALVAIIYTVLDLLADEQLLSAEEAAHADFLSGGLPPRSDHNTPREAIGLIELQEENEGGRTDVIRLCEIAKNILIDATSLEDFEYTADKVMFRFTDTDALWERAVQVCLGQAAAHVAWDSHLHPMRGISTPLYPDGGPNIDPDVVVYGDGSARIIVDAKDYATHAPDAGGVYQISSYARHLGVTHAALVYLAAGREWSESFGDTSVRIHAFGIPVDPRGTLTRLRTACERLIAAASQNSATS